MKRNKLWPKALVKVFAQALSGALIFSLAGCGNEEGSGESQSQQAQPSVTEQESGGQDEQEGGSQDEQESEEQEQEADGAITYPLQTEETLTFWHNNQLNYQSSYGSYEESPFHSGLEEMTGVKVEWQQPVQGVYGTPDEQAYNLLLTEEVLPDIIFNSISSAQAEQLIEDGVIYDLTEYLPKYAPDYWAFITAPENEDYRRDLQTESGRFFNVATATSDYRLNIYIGPVIRQDWLEECNLEAPVTFADWEEVLTVFKEKYDAPFGFWMAALDNAGLGSGTGAYGNFTASLYIDDNGTIQLAQAQPEWKEYMEVLHRWWDLGLIDKDSVSMDDAAVRTKVLNNEIGVTYTLQSRINLWMNDAAEVGSSADWRPLAYPRTAPGEPTSFIQVGSLNRGGSRYSGWGAVVTTSCPEERLATALEWLNYGYTQEGMMYWNYGTEGVTYTLDENGEPQWTELIAEDPAGLTEATMKYVGVGGTGISIRQPHFVEIRMAGNSSTAPDVWSENTDAIRHRIPNISLTDEESVIYTDRLTTISSRTSEMALKYMTGEESLDNFDSFVEELYGMGLQELLDVVQASYDRYIAK